MLLTEILKSRGFNTNTMKVVRHTLKRGYIKEIIEAGNLELYQSIQKTNIFKNIEYFAAFTDMQGTKSLLYGVYKVKDVTTITKLPNQLTKIKDLENWGDGPYFKYDLIRVDKFDDLVQRLVIDWGNAPLSWHQNSTDKEIIEILPEGFTKSFPGYENVILTFDELIKIFKFPDSNRQWKTMLASVYGIYLILDKTDGQQYVGSAYGKDGIWGRWNNYVETKHGGNRNLIDLLNTDPTRYKNFQFSILNVFPNSTIRDEILKHEAITKEKLGTRVHGLNAN